MENTNHQGIQAQQLQYHLNCIQEKYRKEFAEQLTENLDDSLKEADDQLQNLISKFFRVVIVRFNVIHYS